MSAARRDEMPAMSLTSVDEVSSRFRNQLARTGSMALLSGGLTLGLVHPSPAAAASTSASATGAPSCTTQSSAVVSSGGGPAYYLFESNGAVESCGAAPLFGEKSGLRRSNPVVSGAATTAGGGYWLLSARGDVYQFGNAPALGAPARAHPSTPYVELTPTPDDRGYWIVNANGHLSHFGDAGFYGSTVHNHDDGVVIALLGTPDGKGYWIVNSDGRVRNFGDAQPLGSLSHRRPPVVAAAANPDGHGIELLTKDGGVHDLGTSAFYGSLVHHRLARPLTAIAASTSGAGYLLANASGSVFNFGDASFEGSLAATPPRRPTAVIAIAGVSLPVAQPPTLASTPVTPSSLIPHGQFGYDVSNFQCAAPGSASASATLPTSSAFSVIEAAGWLDSSYNSCLAAEAAWATAAAGTTGSHYSLYLFMNAPDQSAGATALDSTGPAGTCASLAVTSRPACMAYNYGYEGALAAFNHAATLAVSAQLWWLDVEGTNLSSTEWSNFSGGLFWSSTTSLNDATIQGSIDALRASGATVGIYSSSVQFPTIAGAFVPTGAQVPLWIAGASWTNPPYVESGLSSPSVLATWCSGTSGYGAQYPSDLFAGGVPWLLQETPGSEPSPYGIDPDYGC